jgi:peptidoglycan/LPS O-acetylase OafA/YrhL
MKLTYRPEIDGLRAIAVVAVIFYHAQITILGYQPFKGGFIGVDIFFVISGYLITSIILKELLTTGTFSFKYFYERRIRRILPVLLFVMLVALPLAWVCLLPNDFVDFSKSILYSLGFSSNFYFHHSGQIYGVESGLIKPFLHTWSLSVEEQYYILFPIVLLVAFKYLRKYIGIVLIIGFIISLIIADWGSRNYPSLNFYVLPTRGWELLAGSILAYFEIKLGNRSKNQMLNLILPSVGFLLIAHSFIFFNYKIFHPSFYTLSPIIGVCLLIWFSHKDELITKILSTKLFVGIGLISYSLYLWHYPIFAFARITEFTHGDILKKLLLGMIILSLSILSYFLIERPSRNKKHKFTFIFSCLFLFLFTLIILNSVIISKDGYKNRLPEILDVEDQKVLSSTIFNSSSHIKIFIVGDSQMKYLAFNLKERVVEKNFSFITSIADACIYFPSFDLVDKKTNKSLPDCNQNYFSEIEKTLKEQKNSIIIFGGRFPLFLTNYFFDNQEGGIEGLELSLNYVSTDIFETIQSSFKNSVDELSKKNKIILIYPIPEVGWDVPTKLFNKLPKKINELKEYLVPMNYITTSYQVYKERTKSSFELLDSIKGDDIYRVYPHTIYCDTLIKDRCMTHDDKNIFYFDNNHPSSKGAEMINELIIKEIEMIEAKFN